MEVRQLRYFVALAEELHFARAAVRVGIAQSPLSKSIKDFESELGARLFTRTIRCVALTRRGEQLLHDARYILAAAADADRSIRTSAEGDFLTVGIAEGVYHPNIIEVLSKHVGDKSPRIRVMPYGRVLREVESGSVDRGMVCAVNNEPTLCAEHICRDPIVVVMARGNARSRSGKIEWNDLEGEPLIIGQCVSFLPRLAGRHVLDTGTDLAQFAILVGAGTGVGVCTASIASFLSSNLIVQPLSGKDCYVDVTLLRSCGL